MKDFLLVYYEVMERSLQRLFHSLEILDHMLYKLHFSNGVLKLFWKHSWLVQKGKERFLIILFESLTSLNFYLNLTEVQQIYICPSLYPTIKPQPGIFETFINLRYKLLISIKFNGLSILSINHAHAYDTVRPKSRWFVCPYFALLLHRILSRTNPN